jgi:hypothetical protein
VKVTELTFKFSQLVQAKYFSPFNSNSLCYVCVRVFSHVCNIAGDTNLLVSTSILCIFTADKAECLTRNAWTPKSRQSMPITQLITTVSLFQM